MFVQEGKRALPQRRPPRVRLARGEVRAISVEVLPFETLSGRCVDSTGAPLAGIAVQAFDTASGLPASEIARSDKEGSFELEFARAAGAVELRATEALHEGSRTIHGAPEYVPPIHATTVLSDVRSGPDTVEVRMQHAPLVDVHLRVPDGSTPPNHVQVERLVFDPEARAWGRIGGAKFQGRGPDARKGTSVVALPRDRAKRPWMLWTWGRSITAVDPRGRDSVVVEIPNGRKITASGSGWRPSDILRVVCHAGPEGEEMPCIWVEGAVGNATTWSRSDAPPCPIEFQLLRGGVVIVRSERIPRSTEEATPVRLDVPE